MWWFRFGRRRPLIAYYAVAGIALILSQVIPEQAGESVDGAVVIMMLTRRHS